jgi:pyruvate/2-oxoglutarate dehydrogenase complex dihydrolipoamide dehydrogenase (E3) component
MRSPGVDGGKAASGESAIDRIVGFTAFGARAGEIMAVVQLAMTAGLPNTVLRDSILTHPTMAEGLVSLFSTVPVKH